MKIDPEKDSAKPTEPSGKGGSFVGKLAGAVVALAIVWLILGGRISYAAEECSKGAKQCAVGIAVALGIVDVYDKNGKCTGGGCNF